MPARKAAVAMKKFISQLLCCAVLAMSAAAAERAPSRVLRIADPAASCEDNMEQDSMETVPATDDPEPVLLKTAEVSCKIPQRPISA